VTARPSRSRWLWLWAVAAAVAVVLAFLVGTHVRSPWEVAVENSHAHPLVTATAETRTLVVADGEVTGTVALGRTQDVVVPAGDGTRAVVTATPLAAGAALEPAAVVVEVSGRPVIGWDLPFPLYRDLRGGMSGPDVRAVQEALHDAGHDVGRVDGVYGPGTARAVEALYREAGAEPPVPSAEAVAAARAADEAVANLLAEPPGVADAPGESDGAAGGAADGGSRSKELADARHDAAQAHVAALVPLPAAETFDLDPAGASIVRVSPVGTVLEPGAPVVQVRSGTPTVTARVGVASADAYQVGAEVTVTAPGGGASAAATVTAVGEFVPEPTDDGAPPGYDVTVELPDGSDFDDASRVTVSAAVGDGTTGLAVPVVALREDASGTFVLRLPPGSDERRERDAEHVSVTVTTTADGYALVAGTELEAGDTVVVATSP